MNGNGRKSDKNGQNDIELSATPFQVDELCSMKFETPWKRKRLPSTVNDEKEHTHIARK